MHARLRLTRQQILAFRRRVGGLEARQPATPDVVAAGGVGGPAGQHAASRAALVARAGRRGRAVDVGGSVARPALGASLQHLRRRRSATSRCSRSGGCPTTPSGRLRAERMAEQLHAHLDGRRMTDREVGARARHRQRDQVRGDDGHGRDPLGGRPRAGRSGRSPPPTIDPADACRELARRYLHIFGPTTAQRLRPLGRDHAARGGRCVRRRSRDRCCPSARRSATSGCSQTTSRRCAPPTTAAAPVRLLPSGDAYFLLDGAERELLVPSADQRQRLWTSRVWPGALLVDGEIRGTWRRAQHTVRIDAWARLSRDRRATRSRPRPAPCRCRASTGRSRWSGAAGRLSVRDWRVEPGDLGSPVPR